MAEQRRLRRPRQLPPLHPPRRRRIRPQRDRPAAPGRADLHLPRRDHAGEAAADAHHSRSAAELAGAPDDPVPRGNRFATLIRATRADFGGEVAIAAADLPPGVTIACENMAAQLRRGPRGLRSRCRRPGRRQALRADRQMRRSEGRRRRPLRPARRPGRSAPTTSRSTHANGQARGRGHQRGAVQAPHRSAQRCRSCRAGR